MRSAFSVAFHSGCLPRRRKVATVLHDFGQTHDISPSFYSRNSDIFVVDSNSNSFPVGEAGLASRNSCSLSRSTWSTGFRSKISYFWGNNRSSFSFAIAILNRFRRDRWSTLGTQRASLAADRRSATILQERLRRQFHRKPAAAAEVDCEMHKHSDRCTIATSSQQIINTFSCPPRNLSRLLSVFQLFASSTNLRVFHVHTSSFTSVYMSFYQFPRIYIHM